jgi:hypothetical protein
MLSLKNSNLIIYLRFCGINNLLDRRLLNLPRTPGNSSGTPKKII